MNGQLFVVTSGRSGSYLLYKLFSLYPQVDAHHEFCCTQVQQLGTMNYLDEITSDDLLYKLKETYADPLNYCLDKLFIDSSNKASWLIRELNRLFPEARFLWLIRDGRKVVSSYFNKLTDECYRDGDVNKLYQWRCSKPNDPYYFIAPSPTKANWWPIPRRDDPIAAEFRYRFDRFQRICWHWQEVNKVIGQSFNDLPVHRLQLVRLEELVSDRAVYERLMAWVGLDATGPGWQLVGKPTNVNVPVNFALTPAQQEQYWAICGDMHRSLGYTEAEAEDVRY